MNEEKVKLRLNIAGESIMLSVPYSQQETARQTESEVNRMFDSWRSRFPEKSDRELLAMIAFRLADRYSDLLREKQSALEMAERLNARVEALMADGRFS